MESPSTIAADMLTIKLQRLSGSTVEVEVKESDVVKVVQRAASLTLGIPEPFLKLSYQSTEVNLTEAVANLAEPVLDLIVLDRLPFQESTPFGARVLVDGYLAEYGSVSTGWSDKISFTFDPPGHPRFGTSFQTKYFICERPGFVQWGHGLDELHVEWLCPGAESRSENPTEAERQPVQVWRTVCSALVRAEANLDSGSVCRLAAGQECLVAEAIYLEDHDATPRLRIISPREGWLTPYLKSKERVLAVPCRRKADSLSDTLADIARCCEQAARA